MAETLGRGQMLCLELSKVKNNARKQGHKSEALALPNREGYFVKANNQNAGHNCRNSFT
jgi:hypothetical protein